MHQSSQIAPEIFPLRLFFKVMRYIMERHLFLFFQFLSELFLICYEMHCIYLYCKVFLSLQILRMRQKTTVFSFATFSSLKKNKHQAKF